MVDLWAEFEENGTDEGWFGDYDRVLLEELKFDRIIARPAAPAPLPLAQPQPNLEVCSFCKNNGQPESVYTSHPVRDKKGNCACPVLRAYTCPTCGQSGDKAHTLKYCPKKKIYTEEETMEIHKRRKNQSKTPKRVNKKR